jgi:hypothetical protein
MVNIPGMDLVNWGGMIDKTIYWVGYGLVFVLVIAAIIAVFVYLQYKYKVTIMQRGGDGSKERTDHSITKIKKDLAKEYKDKNGVTRWKLLFSRKTIQPIEYTHIYPGRNVYLYQTGPSSFFPFKMAVSNPSAVFEPVAHDVNLWAGLELRETALEFTKKTFWEQYGNVAVMMGTIMFCLILVGVTIYYTYQHANGITSSLGGLTEAVRNTNSIPGIGPS